MSNDMIELEMDNPTAFRAPAAPVDNDVIELDLTDGKSSLCLMCNQARPLNERAICQVCADGPYDAVKGAAEATSGETAHAAPLAELARDLTAIGDQGAANAAVQGIGSLRTGQLRGVGFSSKDGYITAIRNGVKSCTHASYLQTLRSQYGMTTSDLAALNLPGPMVETSLPVGAGIVHIPTPGSVPLFDRPAAERAFIVGPKSDEIEAPRIQLEHGKIVAGAAAEGHGVVIGWRGLGQLTRGALTVALASIDKLDLLPAPMSARAQAGHAVGRLNGLGLVVRVARKVKDATWLARWTIGAVNHAGKAGESYGDVALAVELQADGTLVFDGDDKMAAGISADYDARVAAEVYQAGDITSWLGGKLYKEFKAVSFGVGWYVHQKHAAAAEALCGAVSKVGWGYGWILPALPVADSSQLRDGIVRGLTEEVADLMARLASERQTAKAEREDGDIGPKRAGTYLRDLRAIGQRAVAYGEILGVERIATCRDTVRAAVVELETLLGDDYSGIGQRFSLIWDEIERDQSRAGGAL